MFDENIEIIKSSFIDFKGTGLFFALYVISIIYLAFKEKNKKIRAITIYFPFIVLLIILNPIFNKLVGGILKQETYWRMFWILPIGITISYASVKIIEYFSDTKKKIVVSIFIIIVIILSGKNMYAPGNFYDLHNKYKVIDEAVLVTKIIKEDDLQDKKAFVSYYLAPYIRQIDASIKLTYARSANGYPQGSDAVLLGLGEVEKIAKRAKITNSNYIVIHKETPIFGNFEDYGYKQINETAEYRIYRLIEE